MKSRLACVLFLSLLVASLSATTEAELPEGKGKEVVESTCTDCHSVARIKAQHLDEEGWNSIIHEMIENGAPIDANDVSVIVGYLVKNFGPEKEKKTNVNTATADEIAVGLTLAAGEAAAVVQYRTQHGKFKDLSELEKVSGLADKIEAKKALIEF